MQTVIMNGEMEWKALSDSQRAYFERCVTAIVYREYAGNIASVLNLLVFASTLPQSPILSAIMYRLEREIAE